MRELTEAERGMMYEAYSSLLSEPASMTGINLFANGYTAGLDHQQAEVDALRVGHLNDIYQVKQRYEGRIKAQAEKIARLRAELAEAQGHLATWTRTVDDLARQIRERDAENTRLRAALERITAGHPGYSTQAELWLSASGMAFVARQALEGGE